MTLVVMVMVHESGHYSTARLFGMKIEEFFFGFGPRVFSWRRGETEYGMKAIPAGGYVKIAGMNPLVDVPEDEKSRTFGAKPAWQRAIVLCAGSATHMVLAGVLLTVSFAALGTIGNPTTTLASSTASQAGRTGTLGPAEKAGLRPGDTIVAVDGQPIKTWDDVHPLIQNHPNDPIPIEVRRAGKLLTFTVTPQAQPDPNNPGKTIGFIGVSPLSTEHRQVLPVAMWSATKQVGGLIVSSVQDIGSIFSPSGIHNLVKAFDQGKATGSATASGAASPAPAANTSQPVGPVGLARAAGQAAETGQGQAVLGLLAAFIVFLGVMNMLPLPPLDGGHLLVLGLEKLRGHPIDARKVVPVAALVLTTLVLFSVAVLYLDIVHPAANPFQ